MKTIELAKELIGFETVSPITDPDIFEFLKLYLEDNGVNSKIHDIRGVKSLTATLGSGKPSICFSGHLDTVAPGSNWEIADPFEPVVENGKLYGRGATDMKTECAALVNAALRLKKSDFDGSITLMLTGDEEKGGERGTAELAEDMKFDYAIVGEPTDLNVQIGTRGILWLDIVLEGKSAHSSRASRTTGNLFEDVPQVLEKLNNLDLDENEDSLLPESVGEVTTVSADNAYNSVPSEIRFGMDFRYSHSQTAEGIIELVDKELSELEVDYRLEVVKDMMKPWVLKDADFKRTVVDAVADITGRIPEQITEGGASDGRFFAKKGTPFVELGLDQEPVHQQDEYCTVEDIVKLENTYVRVAEKLAESRT